MEKRDFRNFKRTTGGSEKTENTVEKPDKRETGKPTGVSGSPNPSTTTGTGNSTGTGTGNNSGTGNSTGKTETVKNEKVDKLPDVKKENKPLPEVKIPLPNEPKTKKTKKTRSKKDNNIVTVEQITALLVATSSIVASRENCQHWLITENEAKQIAEPLANIIAKNENLKALGEHADAIALVTACLMVFTPRIFTTVMLNKQNKPKKEIIPNARESKGNNKPIDRKTAEQQQNINNSITEFIPAII